MANKLTPDELAKRLDTPGWRLTDEDTHDTANGTLREMLVESHSRKTRGKASGKILEVEHAIELKLFQIEQLWQHLGLPTI